MELLTPEPSLLIWSTLWLLVALAHFVLAVIAVYRLALSRLDGTQKIFGLLTSLLLPIAGPIITMAMVKKNP
jgi:hypothetical protein